MKESVDQSLRDRYYRSITLVVTTFAWAVSGILIVLAISGFLAGETMLIAVWSMFGSTITLLAAIFNAINSKRSRDLFERERTAKEFEKTETLEIMQAITGNYNAVYYLDCLKEEVKFIQIGNRIRTSMPLEFTEKHPVEWYIKTYCDRLVPEEYREDFLKNVNPESFRSKLRDRDYYTYNYIGDKNGEHAYFQMRAAKVNGSENHVVIGFADVDAEVREAESREAMLREALVSVESANRAKTEFLSRMSSDLMSPLHVIEEAAGVIDACEEAGKGVKEAVGKILIGTEDLDVMINDILDMSAMKEGNLFIENSPFDINKALDEAEQLAEYRSGNKNVKIEVSRQIVHDCVIGDAEKFIDMVKHVLYSAIECSGYGGIVNATIIETQVLGGRAFFDLMIEDHGTTIGRSVIEAVYSDNAQVSGSAMGLATTRVMAEMMDGKLEISEGSEGGNAISLYLSFSIGR